MQQISKLTHLFEEHKIGAYIIPTSDEYQNEYVPKSARRLEFVTGFSGSNGFAIILKDKGYFYTDGRYLLQAKDELDQFFEVRDQLDLLGDRGDELSADLKGIKVGFNPKLFTKKQLEAFFSEITLMPIEKDLVGPICNGRHDLEPAFLYNGEYAGEDAPTKLAKIREVIGDKYLLVTDVTSIGWLLNLRGRDVEFSPLLISRLIISKDEVILFTNLEKITPEVRNNLDFVDFREEEEIEGVLASLEVEMLIDEITCSAYLQNIIRNPIIASNPIMESQMIKIPLEIDGAKRAHIQDAIALINTFVWIEDNKNQNITEYDVASQLTYFRSLGKDYVMDSFPSIVGFKERGAIIHYRPHKEKSLKLEGDGMLLLDSGGHYLGGTTDVTRNLYFGQPSEEMKRHYTLVLKSHLALRAAKFKQHTSGKELDLMVRSVMQKEGLDYPHGTGHGVGNFLSVHEGSLVSKRGRILKEGMILSNEPGYYVDGKYGIRIENLLHVVRIDDEYLGFEDLTLVPYYNKLINFSLINDSEMRLISAYYDRIKQNIMPQLKGDAKNWLEDNLNI